MMAVENKATKSTWDSGAEKDCEQRLWQEYRRNKAPGRALSALMEHYLPMVTQTVNRMSARFYHQVEPEDMLGVAILGLYEAIQRYSDSRGVPFSAYARKRIAGAILDDLRHRDPLSREQRSRLRKIQETSDSFTSQNGRPPSDEELALSAGISTSDVARALSRDYRTVSLQEQTGDGLTYQDIIPDSGMPTPREHADKESARAALRHAIPKLDVRDQQLLFFRHSEFLSVAEIADVFGVTPGRVSQMYNSTILRLRSLMKVGAEA